MKELVHSWAKDFELLRMFNFYNQVSCNYLFILLAMFKFIVTNLLIKFVSLINHIRCSFIFDSLLIPRFISLKSLNYKNKKYIIYS